MLGVSRVAPRYFSKSVPLGFDQHRNARGSGALDHTGHIVESTLAIVGEDHHIAIRQRLLDLAHQQGGIDGVEGLFKVQTQQLLVA